MRRRPMSRPKFTHTLAYVVSSALLGLVVFVPSSVAADSLPVISYTVDGMSGNNGWYRGSSHGNNIVLHWTVTDATSVVSGCEPAITIPGPNAGFTKSCTAANDVGSITVTTKVLKIDADPPTGIAVQLSRGPDYNGWYNHPVSASWTAADATSGLASCSSLAYTGPDLSGAQITGSCTDNAGNSTPASSVAQLRRHGSGAPERSRRQQGELGLGALGVDEPVGHRRGSALGSRQERTAGARLPRKWVGL